MLNLDRKFMSYYKDSLFKDPAAQGAAGGDSKASTCISDHDALVRLAHRMEKPDWATSVKKSEVKQSERHDK